MKLRAFALRNTKEIIRDPVNIAFGLGFPIVLLLLLTAIQSNIPNEIFAIARIAPGLAVFGLSFISLFSGTLIAKDRSTSFLMRLFASPLSASDFILGYTLPLIPLAIVQSVICFAAAACLGMTMNADILLSVLVIIPSSLFFIGVGLLTGSVFNDKQVGGVCGALLTNLTGWFSGIWFDTSLVGGVFEKISNALPFVHAVNAAQAAAQGKYNEIFPDLWWVIAYATVFMIIAIFIFRKKMKVT